MHKLILRLNKLVIGMLFIAIVFSNTNKASAYWGVFDFNIQDIPSYIEEAYTAISAASSEASNKISSFANNKDYVKTYLTDIVVKRMAEAAIRKVQAETLNWIQNGFQGKPMFVQNPEALFKNIAINQLTVTKNILVNDLLNTNRNVTRALLVSQNKNANLIKSVTPTITNSVCQNIRDSITLYSRSPSSAAVQELLAQKQQELRDICNNTNKDLGNVNAAKCAGNFSCSGWSGILALTQNPIQNTDQGRIVAIQSATQQAIQDQQNSKQAQINRGSGYQDQETCVKYTEVQDMEGNLICAEYQSVTPGAAANELQNKNVTSPITRLENAKDKDSLFETITGSFIEGITSRGLLLASNYTNSRIYDLNNSINNLLTNVDTNAANDLIQFNNTYASSTGNGSQGGGVGGAISFNASQTNAFYQMSATDTASYLGLIRPDFERKIASNRAAGSFVQEEIKLYFPLQAGLEQIAACYKDKYDQQQALIASYPQIYTPVYLANYLLKSPYEANIPTTIRTRGGEIVDTINSLIDVINRGYAAEQALTEAYNKITNLTDSRDINAAQTAYDEASKNLLDEAYWKIRDTKNKNDISGGALILQTSQNTSDNFQNGSLVARLDRELKALISPSGNIINIDGVAVDDSQLGVCKAIVIDPSQDPKNIDMTAGGL